MSKALITGITGQDGSYLAEFLLGKNYEVHGLVRRVASEDQAERFSRIKKLIDSGKIAIHYGDVTDYSTIWRLIGQLKPDEVYHLASQSNAVISLEDDFGAFSVNSVSAHNLLSAIKELSPESRFFYAGSAEMYGEPKSSPQNEETPFYPNTPYSIAKTAGYNLTRMFRERYKIFACGGILFAHESPRRGFDFVTRKITSTAAKIKAGMEDKLPLGNLDSKKDWTFAGDTVRAMWLMLQQEKPGDYVIGTGQSHTVREFVNKTFGILGLDPQKYVITDPKFFRPAPAVEVVSDAKRAREVLKWQPEVAFDNWVKMMVENDLEKQGSKNKIV